MQEDTVAGGIHKRGKRWHLRWVVPARYKGVEERREIHVSLKTDSESEARKRADAAMADLIEELEARLAGSGRREAEVRFKRTVAMAEAMGLTYRRAADLLAGPVDGLVDAVLRAKQEDPTGKKREVADAILGTAAEPVVMLSELPEVVEKIAAHDNRHKNATQMRKWRDGLLRATRNIVSEVGDKPALEFTRDDAAAHRRFLVERVKNKEIAASSAKKEITYSASMLKRFFIQNRGSYPNFYEGLSVSDKFEKPKSKLYLPVRWMRRVLLNMEAMAGLDEQTRDICLVVMETGCRQSEIFNLFPENIVLDSNIPYIDIANIEAGREVKNKSSPRRVPLLGLALSATRRHPLGFPFYRGNDYFSTYANSYFGKRNLWPIPEDEDEQDERDFVAQESESSKLKFSIGCLRHSWEYRAEKAGLNNINIAYTMGHNIALKKGRPVYGSPRELPTKKRLMEKIVLDVEDPWA